LDIFWNFLFNKFKIKDSHNHILNFFTWPFYFFVQLHVKREKTKLVYVCMCLRKRVYSSSFSPMFYLCASKEVLEEEINLYFF
jgi:hypothetical protein